ncbi:MAG: ChpI protein [Desulfobacteraceae bacterium]|nr:ChpI protein [Desulfobacteraceae bacterium]
MRTAISLPDKLFYIAEEYAKEHGFSRSELYATAVSEFIEKNKEEDITRQINEVCDIVDTSLTPQIEAASRRVLSGAEW